MGLVFGNKKPAMNIDDLINKAIKTHHFTFKSDGKLTEFELEMLKDGSQVGFNIAYNNLYQGKSYCDLMAENKNCNKPYWNNGFMEGIHTGESKKLSERFPKAKRIWLNIKTNKYEAEY